MERVFNLLFNYGDKLNLLIMKININFYGRKNFKFKK